MLLFREDSHIGSIDPVVTVKTGKRGRPRKEVDYEFLHDAMSGSRGISVTKLAKALHMDRHVLSKRLAEAGVSRAFTGLRRSDLDELVKGFRTVKPNSGVRYLIGFLRQRGLRVQKRRVYASIQRVDGLGRALRQRHTIRRRTYKVSQPNALWHVDGHHKLILWGFVIHGFVDGCSRTVRLSAFLWHGQLTHLPGYRPTYKHKQQGKHGLERILGSCGEIRNAFSSTR